MELKDCSKCEKSKSPMGVKLAVLFSGLTLGFITTSQSIANGYLRTIDEKIKELHAPNSYVDISDKWYDNIAYLGFNKEFCDYEYAVYWYENETPYFKVMATAMQPSDAIEYIENHPDEFIGDGFEVK